MTLSGLQIDVSIKELSITPSVPIRAGCYVGLSLHEGAQCFMAFLSGTFDSRFTNRSQAGIEALLFYGK